MTELKQFLQKTRGIEFFNPRKYEPNFQITLKKGLLTLGSGLAKQLGAQEYSAVECAYNRKRVQLLARLVRQEEVVKAGGLGNTSFIVLSDQASTICFDITHILFELGLPPDKGWQFTPEILEPAKAILAITLGTREKKERKKRGGKGTVERI